MRIVLISDTHLAASAGDFVSNAKAAIAWINETGPDLVVALGDLSADGVKDPDHLMAAHETLSNIKVPVRYLPGNHDVGDNPGLASRRHLEPIVEAEALERYRRLFGPDYWSFTASGWTILGLNAQLFGLNEFEEMTQWQWIEDRVAEQNGPIGLMLHKPLFNAYPNDGDHHHRYVPLEARLRLLDLLREHDLRFVVSGHTHQARNLMYAGVEHVWTPSTAFIIPDYLQERIGEKVVGFISLELTPQGHSFKPHVTPDMRPFQLDDYQDVYGALKTVVKPVNI